MYKKFNQIQKLEIAANAIDNDSPILLLHKFDKDYTHKNKEKQNKGRKKYTDNKRQKQNKTQKEKKKKKK